MGLNSNAYMLEDSFVGGDSRASSCPGLGNTRCGQYNAQADRGKWKANYDIALYIPDMKPGRGIGHDGNCEGIDGNEESCVRLKVVSCPSNMKIPQGNGQYMANSSKTTAVVMIVKAGVTCRCQGYGGKGLRMGQARVMSSTLVEHTTAPALARECCAHGAR